MIVGGPGTDDYERYDAFASEFEAESDRAAAVLAGAYLDALLGEMLLGFLVNHKETQALLSDGGPVGTFSARVRLGFALGLISDTMRRDLQLIARIRNRFAHLEAKLSFQNGPISDICSELRIVESARQYMGPDHPLAKDSRLQFLATVHFAMVHLRTAVREPCRVPRP